MYKLATSALTLILAKAIDIEHPHHDEPVDGPDDSLCGLIFTEFDTYDSGNLSIIEALKFLDAV